MDIVVRPITKEDYLQVIEVIKRSNTDSLGKIYPKKLIDDFLTKYTSEKFIIKATEIDYFVAEDRELKKIVGVIGLKKNEVRTFFVDPLEQGKGIGRKLFDYLEKEARARGVETLVLEGSPLGQPVYEHFGFKKIKTVEKERAGVVYTDAYMEKKLV